ncbi:MAG: SDR family NAD(P)-dependent oxidoreductase [Acidobacteria bacterium]|nr:SDR family NAD(P)-dependent oxidoreductase [Acidobacteriota bacterium]
MGYFDLTGHTAIITGAASGIGAAIARRLAKAGATVVIADINGAAAAEVAATISGALSVQMDVTSTESVQAAVDGVIAQTGQVHILVNNAGIGGKAAPLWEQDIDDWHKCIAINMDGVWNGCKAVIAHMRANKYGRIVNIASIAGKEGNPNMSAYSATKAAVIGFTKSIAKEVATDGVCVNAVSPAVVRTPILEQLTPQQVAYMTEKIPMRRTGEPEEIAAVVHFLSSPDCSFVTAQTYDASGGRATY